MRGTDLSEFVRAATLHLIVKLTDLDGNERYVAPYVVFETEEGNICISTFKVAGFSSSKPSAYNWRTYDIDGIQSCTVEGAAFTVQEDYRPNSDAYHKVYFSIPDATGYQRHADLSIEDLIRTLG